MDELACSGQCSLDSNCYFYVHVAEGGGDPQCHLGDLVGVPAGYRARVHPQGSRGDARNVRLRNGEECVF